MKQVKITIALILLTLAISCADTFAQTAQDHPCKAMTKDGKQCKMPAMKDSDYCMVHNPNAPRCGVIKKDGKPCQMRVKKQGDHCRYHQ